MAHGSARSLAAAAEIDANVSRACTPADDAAAAPAPACATAAAAADDDGPTRCMIVRHIDARAWNDKWFAAQRFHAAALLSAKGAPRADGFARSLGALSGRVTLCCHVALE